VQGIAALWTILTNRRQLDAKQLQIWSYLGAISGHSHSLPSHDEATFAPLLHILYRSCFAARVGTTNHFDTQACDGDLGLDDMSDHLYWDTGYYLPASLQNG